MEKMGDGRRGAAAAVIERAVVIRESGMIPAGFGVANDGEVFHGRQRIPPWTREVGGWKDRMIGRQCK